ncbi:MAG TPA: hypothetical protein VGC25_04370, partial [Alphaproteobacteria bacterium]
MAMIFQPKAVVLTKFGPDATESAEQILARKELERRSGRRTHENEFWWGIGEKGIAKSICYLIEHHAGRAILFTTIKDQKPPANSSAEVFVWNRYK